MTILAPISAAILQARPKYLESLDISLPTAVIASTGIPNCSASFINLPKLEMVRSSFSAPTNIDIPIPETFNFKASCMETITSSFESSFKTLGPPDTLRQIDVLVLLSIQFLNMPLVTKRQSAFGRRGATVSFKFSSPVVGP